MVDEQTGSHADAVRWLGSIQPRLVVLVIAQRSALGLGGRTRLVKGTIKRDTRHHGEAAGWVRMGAAETQTVVATLPDLLIH